MYSGPSLNLPQVYPMIGIPIFGDCRIPATVWMRKRKRLVPSGSRSDEWAFK